MCLSVQGEVLQVEGTFAWVNSLGRPARVSIAAVPAVRPGEWVLIRAGMALDVLSAAEAQELDAFSQEFLAFFEQDPENHGSQIASPESKLLSGPRVAEDGTSPFHPFQPSFPRTPTSQGGSKP